MRLFKSLKSGVEFAESKYVTLGIKDAEKNLFTNLAWLISDQCTHSVKVAVFEDLQIQFLDRQNLKVRCLNN